MSEQTNIPSWVRSAARVDRPEVDARYKPEDGALDGVLLWRGQRESATSGDVFNTYVIRESGTGKMLGLSELAGLRDLRNVRVGSRVFIRPTTIKALDNGHKMQQFEIFAEQLEPLAEPVRGAGNRVGGPPSDSGAGGSDKVPF